MAKAGGGSRHRGPKTLSVSPPPALAPYVVHLTQSAENVYSELRKNADAALARGDSSNQHCTTFRMVDDAIRRLIPANPKSPAYALHKPLNNVYRIAKGRMRIAWVAVPDTRELLILFISVEPRRDGDKKDPYAILTAMAKSGHLNKLINDWSTAFYVPPGALPN